MIDWADAFLQLAPSHAHVEWLCDMCRIQEKAGREMMMMMRAR